MADNRYKVKALHRYSGKAADAQSEEQNRFQTFEDLEAYQVSREFRKAMYAMSPRLPEFERFALASQICRAAVSLTNNLAEGHGRYHYPDQIKFLLQSRGSLKELMDDLNTCLDENYLPAAEIDTLKQLGWRALNVINSTAASYARRRLEKYRRSAKARQPLRSMRTTIRSLTSRCNDVTF